MQMKRWLRKSSPAKVLCYGLGLPSLGLWLLLWASTSAFPPQDKLPGGDFNISSLTPPEKAVLDHLRQDWTKKYRTTSIGLAAEVTRMKLSDDSRLRLVRLLESSRKQYPVLARHGTTTVSLTPQEKLIARTLLLREVRSQAGSKLEEVAGDLLLPARLLKQRLEFMQKVGIVLTEGEGTDLRYHVADRFPRKPSYRIDFQSHQTEVNDSDKFEVA
jgi:hypothetical protein